MATATHLRHINQRRIVHALMRSGEASRAQLSEQSGMSQPTVSRIVDDLLAAHVLAEVVASADLEAPDPVDRPADARPVLGRPSKLLSLDRSRRRIGVVQLGVRRTRLASLPLGVNLGAPDEWATELPAAASSEAWLRSLKANRAAFVGPDTQVIVLSVPGVVDESAGRVLLSPNLKWTVGIDLPKLLKPIARVPVVLVQEVRALALGQLAADTKLRDFVLIDLGDGVGAAAVIGGQLYRGPLPLSGELGHTPVVGNTRRCGCGGVGCVETLLSRRGLLQSAREHAGVRTWPTLVNELAETVPPWLRPSLDALATNIAAAVNMLGVPDVVLTGNTTELPQTVGDYLARAIRGGSMWNRFGRVTSQVMPRRRVAGCVSLGINHLLDRTGTADNPSATT